MTQILFLIMLLIQYVEKGCHFHLYTKI